MKNFVFNIFFMLRKNRIHNYLTTLFNLICKEIVMKNSYCELLISVEDAMLKEYLIIFL